jgi:hypothetical protein
MIMRISLGIYFLFLTASVQAVAAPKPWGIVVNSKYQFSLHESGDARKNSSLISTLALRYSFAPNFRVQGVLGGIQAIQPSLQFRTINPEMRGFYSFSNSNSAIQLSLGPTLNLPFGSDAKDESLIVGAGLGGRVAFNGVSDQGVGFNCYYDLTFNRNFHQFDTSVYAEVNNQYSLNHSIYLEYNFSSMWSVNSSFSFSSLWNYFGTLSNNYSFDQEIDFAWNSYLTLYVSHIRGGDFLAPNGQNYSFGLFDPNRSRITLGLALAI